MKFWDKLFVAALLLLVGMRGMGQNKDVADWIEAAGDHYLVYPDRVYGVASGTPLKLDVWQAQTSAPVPTIV